MKFFNLRGNLFYDDSISGHIISLMLTFGKSNVFSPLISSFYKTRIFEKKQAGYDAAVILDDTGGKYINFKLEFPKRKEGVNGRK